MPNPQGRPIDCPIWGRPYKAYADVVGRNADGEIVSVEGVVYSDRAGGQFKITEESYMALRNGGLSEQQKEHLTSFLVGQRIIGIDPPSLNRNDVWKISNLDFIPPLPLHQRAERLLRYTISKTTRPATCASVPLEGDEIFAWTESRNHSEVIFMLQYLEEKNFIKWDYTHQVRNHNVWVTVDGYAEIEELATNPDSSQAFVAMWFDDSMDAAYDKGIYEGIMDAGFTPMRIDRKQDVIKIDDEIIAQIRRSRLIVADMTHGDKGARGGVYFEAGFALGLNLPVIYCCRDDDVSEIHFDIRQYHHIFWKTPEELRKRLNNRIRAIVGEGPMALQNHGRPS